MGGNRKGNYEDSYEAVLKEEFEMMRKQFELKVNE
jgi:hypothetical protein